MKMTITNSAERSNKATKVACLFIWHEIGEITSRLAFLVSQRNIENQLVEDGSECKFWCKGSRKSWGAQIIHSSQKNLLMSLTCWQEASITCIAPSFLPPLNDLVKKKALYKIGIKRSLFTKHGFIFELSVVEVQCSPSVCVVRLGTDISMCTGLIAWRKIGRESGKGL